MLVCMRTTINLPDGLAEAAKAKATAQGTTFTRLVEEGLRAVLERDDEATVPSAPLPAYGNPDATILIDLTDREAVWTALDTDDPT
jgi:hypothetical protein